MKKSEFIFSLILVPIDYAMLILAALSAYYLRFSEITIGIRPVIFEFDINNYFPIALLVALLWLVVFAFSGLYKISAARGLAREIQKTIMACSMGLVLVVIYIFFQRELFNSRFIILAAWIFAIVYVILARAFIRWLQKFLYSHGIGVHQVILVGYSKTADSLIREFFSRKNSGYEVIKRVRDFSLDTAHELADFIKAYELGDSSRSNEKQRVDEIIQADPNLSKVEILRLFDFANDNHLTFRYVADLLDVKVLRTEVADIAGIPVVEVKRTTLEGWGAISKRIFDVIVSGILILLLSPIIIIAIIAIKLDSHGPIFFSRRDDGSFLYRVGQGGRAFKYFKFRSMIPGTDSMRYKELADRNIRGDGPMVKIKDDPRVTRVGRFIRRWSIDELPELFLVFIGRMSLVGPRPHLPEEVAKYEQNHRKTLTVKPGITGLAQVSGRSDLAFEEEVKLDIYYIENWSLLLDIAILLKTPLAVLRHRSAE
jgi:exopolysaccharide biosynthesis polyprenyl glycosylphosphotransferase